MGSDKADLDEAVMAMGGHGESSFPPWLTNRALLRCWRLVSRSAGATVHHYWFLRDLSENELVWPIPTILGNLSYSGKLYLHGNKLTGHIPPELGNMSKLSYLQLNDNELE
ncbi:hypothetical protein PVAP13_6KG236006 [Panicum virgatum]|uniref:Uncharacterized protein n=1 Tax=Panicum virgatum TaxID=38727 RepID=A0A8T0REL9_PANVG|nr:hypothetical protein PVAP13_6KG236006 [Panicum virgatum]